MNLRHALPDSPGFSVLELLVSVTVLSILVLILSQIVVLTGQAIGANTRKLDGAGQTRLFFSRLESDLAQRPRRPDLGMTVVKAAGNDSLRFYSGVGGYSGSRMVSLVGYRVQETAAGRLFQLERGVAGSGWAPSPSAGQPLFLSQSLAAPPDADYEVLARGIFRMEISYLLNTPALANRFSVTAASDYSNVEALIVTIA
ncbi:MAG TPA: prepilin-type N-terminal cleavage/methylation domain-containing protein, partial [Candidatus Methylacidiphilales bacterium]